MPIHESQVIWEISDDNIKAAEILEVIPFAIEHAIVTIISDARIAEIPPGFAGTQRIAARSVVKNAITIADGIDLGVEVGIHAHSIDKKSGVTGIIVGDLTRNR